MRASSGGLHPPRGHLLLQMIVTGLLLVAWHMPNLRDRRPLWGQGDLALQQNVQHAPLQQRKHRLTTAPPLQPPTTMQDNKMASVKAAASHWSCAGKPWTMPGRKAVLFTDENLQKQKMAEAPEAGQARPAGFSGPLPMSPGDIFVTSCHDSSQVLDCYSGKIGAWPMLEATARRETGEKQGPLTGSPDLGFTVKVPWRARNLRAARFQHPQHRLRSAKRLRPHCAAWSAASRRPPPAAAASGATTSCTYAPPAHPKAHNLSLPTASMLRRCTQGCTHKAHNFDHHRMQTHPESTSVPSGPKSGGCRQPRPALRMLMLATVGARVSSAAAVTEDGPGLRPGKHHGTAQQGREPAKPTRHMKRAFNRACKRANQSIEAGTWYRNRWHTRAALDALRNQTPTDLGRPPRTAARRRQRATRPEFSFRILTWNAGGLSAALTQELMAWCDTREATDQYDCIVITETHWKQVDDYRSGQWLCVHSSGYVDGQEPDRYAGILCLLSSRSFAEPKVKEHVRGRLLQVTATHIRSQLPTCIIGLYQHVWRPHLSSAQNRALRGSLWQSLQSLITATPARHQLLVAGDFNSTLTKLHPHIGPAVPKPSSHSNLDNDLQTLIQECDLCALNTWHARPMHTFTSPSVKSQLDYVLLRTSTATHGAKLAKPLHQFPVGAYRQTNHHPVQAAIRMLPMAYRASTAQAGHKHHFAAAALQSAVTQHSASAQALLQAVEERLLALPQAQALSTEHDLVNTILLEETCRAFPPTPREDQRVSAQTEYRASARGTWQLHRQLQRSGMPSLRNIWSRWRTFAQFMRASTMLRRQSRDLKKQFLEDQMRQAELAARKGNHRDLFLIARRLGPKTAQNVSRLQGPDGQVLDSKAEMAAIIKHSSEAFASTPDTTSLQPLEGAFTFTATDLQAELATLNIRKAVPRHIAPNAVWRLCAHSISARLGPCFEHHFRPMSTDVLEGDMQDAHICWLNKPSKPPTSMSAKRPIGLMPPCAKSLAGAVARRILDHLQPVLDHMPQFAYCAGRGVNDAILRVHSYFNEIESLQKGQIKNRFKQHQNVRQLDCHGGACLSLDLSSAFDSVSRDLLIQSLLDHQVPPDLINIVQQLHRNAKYIFSTTSSRGQVTTSNGIKQGCRAAPTLWISSTLSILEHLAHRRSLTWIQNMLTLFADDFCGHWTITNLQDWTATISDLTLLMETLETYKLQVNLQKTALLVNLKGRMAKKILRQHVRYKAGETFLVLVVHGQECLLKIKESHTYLGTIISYRDRISAAQARYQQLRKILNGRGPLSIKYRLRLWQACIPPSITYSLEATGCTCKGLQRIKVVATRHLRAILREPAHLHHVSTSDIWERARLPTPEQSILARMTKLRSQRSPDYHPCGPDLVVNDRVAAQLSAQIAHLQEAIRQLAQQGLSVPEEAQPSPNPGFACAHCDLVLPAHARLIHSAIKHAEAPAPTDPRLKPQFHAPDHSVNGLPTCKLCHRNFTKWQQLKLHIENGSCIGLGGDSMKLSPPAEDNQAMRNPVTEAQAVTATARAYEGPESQEQAAQNAIPIITDPSFLSKLNAWDQHLNCRHTRARLQSRCVVCGMWIADGKHLKQHYNKVHHHDFPNALEQVSSPGAVAADTVAPRWGHPADMSSSVLSCTSSA